MEEQFVFIYILEVAYMFVLSVEPTEKVDIPRALDFSGERLALVVFADVGEVIGVVAEHAANGEWALPRGGELVHALFVLYEPKDEVALLEGATAHSATVVSAQALLVNGRSGECEVSFLVEEIDAVLADELVFFFGVIDDPWRVVVDVGRHDSFGAVHQEEGRVASRSVRGGANAPEYRR
jgi:hypothetical protein